MVKQLLQTDISFERRAVIQKVDTGAETKSRKRKAYLNDAVHVLQHVLDIRPRVRLVLLNDKLALALFRNLEEGVARHVLHARVLLVHELQREEGGVRNVECQRQRGSKRQKIGGG